MGNQIVGSRIEQRRKQLGMTLEDIAQELGVAKSTIQRYEKGTIDKVKLPVIEAIAHVLSVNPAWICGKTDIMEPEKPPISDGCESRMRIKDRVKEWKSNKSARLYMCIDSNLLDSLEILAKEDKISLEDEIEKILYEGLDYHTEEEMWEAEARAEAEQVYREVLVEKRAEADLSASPSGSADGRKRA